MAMPLIHENFKRYAPPRWFRATVQRLLDSLSPAHLAGIDSIVLTDSEAIGKGKTRRVGGKRKYLRRDCLGFYYRASRTQGAWIELVVDNIVPPSTPGKLVWFQLMRDLRVAETLYHEIGHHLDATVGSAARGGERAADDWQQRLSRLHFQKTASHLRPLLFILNALLPLARWVARRLGSGKELAEG